MKDRKGGANKSAKLDEILTKIKMWNDRADHLLGGKFFAERFYKEVVTAVKHSNEPLHVGKRINNRFIDDLFVEGGELNTFIEAMGYKGLEKDFVNKNFIYFKKPNDIFYKPYKHFTVSYNDKKRAIIMLPRNVISLDGDSVDVTDIIDEKLREIDKHIGYKEILCTNSSLSYGRVILASKKYSDDRVLYKIANLPWKALKLKGVNAIAKVGKGAGLFLIPPEELNAFIIKSLSPEGQLPLKRKVKKSVEQVVEELLEPHKEVVYIYDNVKVRRGEIKTVSFPKKYFTNLSEILLKYAFIKYSKSHTFPEYISANKHVFSSLYKHFSPHYKIVEDKEKEKNIILLPGKAIITAQEADPYKVIEKLDEQINESFGIARNEYNQYKIFGLADGRYYIIKDQTAEGVTDLKITLFNKDIKARVTINKNVLKIDEEELNKIIIAGIEDELSSKL